MANEPEIIALQRKEDGEWKTVETGSYSGWLQDQYPHEGDSRDHRCVNTERGVVVSVFDEMGWEETDFPMAGSSPPAPYTPKDIDDARIHLLSLLKYGLDVLNAPGVTSSFDNDNHGGELIVEMPGFSLVISSDDIVVVEDDLEDG